MAKKYLQELLNEEQEPFVLTNYINERRSQLRKPPPKTYFHLNRRRIALQNPIFFSCNFRKNPCLFPSSAVKSSPLFDFQSPATNPFLKTSQKPKNLRFGLLGSILKRISPRKKAQKREICKQEIRVSVRDILRWDSFDGLQIFSDVESEESLEKNVISEVGISCSCETSGWSEDFEMKSTDLESSSSSSSSCCRPWKLEERNEGNELCQKGSPSTPSRFRELELLSDSGHETPDYSSPAATPGRRKTEILGSMLFPCTRADESVSSTHKEYEEEEKEQFSPVSVLDAPFDDDDDGHDVEEEEDVEIFEHTFAAMQRAKIHLLNKIRRFEQLADLDPVELEKRIAEAEAEEECSEMESGSVDNDLEEEFIRLVLSQLDDYPHVKSIPTDLRTLLLDLAEYERGDEDSMDVEAVANKVSKSIESWKHVKPNTIDMMVSLDFRREDNKWQKNLEEVREVATKIESAIFGLLVEELRVDLVS